MLGARRLPALILTFLALMGTFGVADLDAWLYHSHGPTSGIPRPHYERRGTSCGHADRCALGVTFPGPRAAAPIGTVGRLLRVSRVPHVGPAPQKPHASVSTTLSQPRAPPFLPA